MPNSISKVIKTSIYIFAGLGVLFIPFPFNIFPYQATITNFLFGGVIKVVATSLFGIQQYYQEISSDSSSMYVLVFILFCLAILISFVIAKTQVWNKNKGRVLPLLSTVFCYYLALQLMNYGVDKIFKSQFYLPEPNILYTPFGQLDKDILFWSTMGTSYTYNLFIGSAQLIAATLILFHKTRVLGLLVSCSVFTNIIAINFSYDISVKLYVCFLFMLSLVTLLPHISKLYQFFVLNKASVLETKKTSFSLVKHPRIKPLFKSFVILLMLLEVLSPYLKSGVFNDDLAQRPFLHGAYQIEEIRSLDSIQTLSQIPIKRIFIHRNGYLILQDDEDKMVDYKLQVNPNENQLLLTDYSLNQRALNYTYSSIDSTLKLQYFYQKKEYQLTLKSLDWRSLPVLKNRFHWRIDE